MSKLHVLTAGSNNQYTVIVHIATPAGNNSASMAWTDIALALGFKTQMSIGTGPGQITQSEADQIAAGTLLEAVAIYWDDVTLNASQRLAALDAVGVTMAAQTLSSYQTVYKYYGLTRT